MLRTSALDHLATPPNLLDYYDSDHAAKIYRIFIFSTEYRKKRNKSLDPVL
jgi:hypothetical protein